MNRSTSLVLAIALAVTGWSMAGAQPAPRSTVTRPPVAVQRQAVTPALRGGGISFKAETPAPPSALPIFQLSSQRAPIVLLNNILAKSRAPAQLAPLSETPFFRKNEVRAPNDALGVVQDEHVRAWVDPKTGDAAVYPELSTLQPLGGDLQVAASRAAEIFRSPDFIASDDTKFVVDKPAILNGATLVREGGATRTEKAKAAYLAYISARRYVGDMPVDGPGSRALVVIGANGQVEGLTRVWRTAKTIAMVKPTRGPAQVREDIIRQLRASAAGAVVTVERIELVYYDRGGDYLQPAYRFTARIHYDNTERQIGRDDFTIGYVPVADLREPLPDLANPGPSPVNASPKGPATGGPAAPGDPIVGRYVVRNDSAGWVNDANAFWGALSATWTGPLFTNSQYFWAEPRLFTNQKNAFINAMHLALIEVHGDWWLYSTRSNCCDLVNINGDIPFPGYGPSAGGRLADWIIHSCEVVPAPDDTAHWPDPWWTVFGGVRNVVGYRTIMYIADGAGGPYGSSLGHLAPVVSSWLSDVISLGAYAGHPTTPAHGGIVRPMGRPSTISACGHDGDSALSTSALGRAGCLTVWWFPD